MRCYRVAEHANYKQRQDHQIGHIEDRMTALLEGAGHEVRHAATLEAARSLLEVQIPDAILLDLHLPDGHGLDLMSQLTQNPAFANVAVLVVTGSESGSDQLPKPVQVDGLQKPVGNRELLDRINVALAGKIKPNVLVVEDDALTRDVLTRLLEQKGLAVRQAANGAAISQTQPELWARLAAGPTRPVRFLQI